MARLFPEEKNPSSRKDTAPWIPTPFLPGPDTPITSSPLVPHAEEHEDTTCLPFPTEEELYEALTALTHEMAEQEREGGPPTAPTPANPGGPYAERTPLASSSQKQQQQQQTPRRRERKGARSDSTGIVLAPGEKDVVLVPVYRGPAAEGGDEGEGNQEEGAVPVMHIEVLVSEERRISQNYSLKAFMEPQGLMAELERAYAALPQRVGRDLAFNALYKQDARVGLSMTCRVDLSGVVPGRLGALLGVHDIRAFRPEGERYVLYCLPDVLRCLDYKSSGSAAHACRALLGFLPNELQLRVVNARWSGQGGTKSSFAEVGVVKGLLLCMSARGRSRGGASRLRVAFDDAAVEEFACRLLLGRLYLRKGSQ